VREQVQASLVLRGALVRAWPWPWDGLAGNLYLETSHGQDCWQQEEQKNGGSWGGSHVLDCVGCKIRKDQDI
jgi:hypothetical protein